MAIELTTADSNTIEQNFGTVANFLRLRRQGQI